MEESFDGLLVPDVLDFTAIGRHREHTATPWLAILLFNLSVASGSTDSRTFSIQPLTPRQSPSR